jgi:beta-phosphoglucomutase-like phosphatase (HAD superfamily)
MIANLIVDVPSHIKALIFDLDGTLVDNMGLHRDAWEETGVDYDLPITGAMIDEMAGIPTRQIIELLADRHAWQVTDYDQFTRDKQAKYRSIKTAAGKTTPIVPMLELVHAYRGILPMSVGTGSNRKGALQSLEDVELTEFFELIVTADDVELGKPHPEVFLKSAIHMGIAPADCLVFEDGPMGMKAAEAAGMPWVDIRPLLADYAK